MLSNDRRPPNVPRSAFADTLLERLTEAYAAAADPVRARAMSTYMKDVAPFLGIPTPLRRELSKAVTKDTPRPSEADCAALALCCWRLPEREYHYFAVDYLRRHVSRCSSGLLPVARHLITTVPWWDTVDLLAAHTVGPLVAADPALAAVTDEWSGDEDLWLVRTALLHQLRFKSATDTSCGSSATAAARRTTRTSSSARPSAGACGSTRRPTPPPCAPSSRPNAAPCPRCPYARRSRTSERAEIHSTGPGRSGRIRGMSRYAFPVASSAVADAPKAAASAVAVPAEAFPFAAFDGARS